MNGNFYRKLGFKVLDLSDYFLFFCVLRIICSFILKRRVKLIEDLLRIVY